MVKGSENTQVFISVEKQTLTVTECEDIPQAVVSLVSTYYAFNMSYPGSLYPVYIFIQHYVLDIKDEQRLPNNVVILYTSISNLDD